MQFEVMMSLLTGADNLTINKYLANRIGLKAAAVLQCIIDQTPRNNTIGDELRKRGRGPDADGFIAVTKKRMAQDTSLPPDSQGPVLRRLEELRLIEVKGDPLNWPYCEWRVKTLEEGKLREYLTEGYDIYEAGEGQDE